MPQLSTYTRHPYNQGGTQPFSGIPNQFIIPAGLLIAEALGEFRAQLTGMRAVMNTAKNSDMKAALPRFIEVVEDMIQTAKDLENHYNSKQSNFFVSTAIVRPSLAANESIAKHILHVNYALQDVSLEANGLNKYQWNSLEFPTYRSRVIGDIDKAVKRVNEIDDAIQSIYKLFTYKVAEESKKRRAEG